MSKLIVMSGVPGSGKSYLSHCISYKLHSHLYIVSSDALRKAIAGNQQDLSQDKIMWEMFYELPKSYAFDKKALTILDATNPTHEARTAKIEHLKKYYDEVILVVFDLDKELVKHQNLEREFPIPEDVMERFFDYFEPINEIEYEFYDKVYLIKNVNEVREIVEALLN